MIYYKLPNHLEIYEVKQALIKRHSKNVDQFFQIFLTLINILLTSFIINKKKIDFLIFFNHYSDNQESLYNFMGISIGGDICLTPILHNSIILVQTVNNTNKVVKTDSSSKNNAMTSSNVFEKVD